MLNGPTSFHVMNTDLVGEGGIASLNFDLFITKVGVFIAHERSEAGDLNVQANYLLLCMLELEITVHGHAASGGSPGPASDILAIIPKEVEVS